MKTWTTSRIIHRNCTIILLSRRMHDLMSCHVAQSDRHMSNRSHCRSRFRGRLHAGRWTGQETPLQKPIPAKAFPFAAFLSPRTSDTRQPATQANSSGTPPIRRGSHHTIYNLVEKTSKTPVGRSATFWGPGFVYLFIFFIFDLNCCTISCNTSSKQIIFFEPSRGVRPGSLFFFLSLIFFDSLIFQFFGFFFIFHF